jgi:hypothetical protein
METRAQAVPLFTAICALIALLVVVQLWLLSASLDSALAGEAAPALAGAVASAVLLVANALLLRFVMVLDHRTRRRSSRSSMT